MLEFRRKQIQQLEQRWQEYGPISEGREPFRHPAQIAINAVDEVNGADGADEANIDEGYQEDNPLFIPRQ